MQKNKFKEKKNALKSQLEAQQENAPGPEVTEIDQSNQQLEIAQLFEE